jgi:hypothetical protein
MKAESANIPGACIFTAARNPKMELTTKAPAARRKSKTTLNRTDARASMSEGTKDEYTPAGCV